MVHCRTALRCFVFFGLAAYHNDPFNPTFLDWTNPDYSVRPPAAGDIIDFGDFSTKGKRKGAFIQNHLDVTDKLLVSFGVRYDDIDLDDRDYTETVYQGGVRYSFNDAIAVYASYSESFGPQFSYDVTGDLLEPEVGEGYELGIKGMLFDGRVSYNAAFFAVTKTNVAVPDPSFPLFSIAGGEWESQGFEADLQGRVTDALTLIFSIGITDTEDENGDSLPNAAEFTSAAFVTYALNAEWDVSLGYEHVGKRENAGYSVDTHTIFNAAVGYTRGPWRAQLNVTNLTDERYLDALSYGFAARGNYPGAPAQGMLTVTYSR